MRLPLIFALVAASSLLQAPGPQSLPLETLKLPAGFKIEPYATGVQAARELARGAKGTVFAGSMRGNVYAIVDADGDHRGERVVIVARGLNQPSGVAFRDGALYVAEISRVIRFDNIEAQLDAPPQPVVVNDTFPRETHHGWKFIAFGPDGLLYVPIGAPCNVCEVDVKHGIIARMKPDGSELETFASGVRNSVGFDWHPTASELWFTDNGRDMLGDDVPPDELNRAPKAGLHFGYPYCHAGEIKDPEFGGKKPCSEFEPPMQKLGPHVAAIGMRFYTGRMFPAEYQNQIFIAEHGSWNRSTKIGYRVSLVKLGADGRPESYTPFIEGWVRGDTAWGRPADVLVMPDGALLISDDTANVIYRVSYMEGR